MEKLGIPTVTVATSEFIGLAKSSSESFGAPDQSFVVVPHPMGMIPLEEIRAKADAAFPEILKAATEWTPSRTELPPSKPPYPAEVIEFEGTEADVHDLFFKNGWSLGVPIIPPTPERVQEMLKGTSHKPDELIGLLTPRMGGVTVELVAVHGVMAGCKPEHMPVLLAIAEALVRPEYRGPTTTTNPTAPLFIVNGPIRDEIGLAYGQGAAGPGHLANVCLGLAANSLGDVIGGSKPPEPDKTTLGWPGNTIAIVIGENEEANPWGPLHVEKGFKKDENVLTVMLGAEIPSNINDHNSTKGEDLLRVVAYEMRRAGQNSRMMSDSDVLVLFSPEHAATIYNDGWTDKDKIRQFLWENAAIPVQALPGGGKDPRYSPEAVSQLLGKPATLETLVPMVKEPARIQIAVAGGAGKHSQYVSSFGAQTPRLIHISIDKWR
ncbi:MAG: thiol-disulfide oxidoreductase [Anaerolineae bacterium]|nr:thiol-disulfide oxidoreductase [Anaerolineae bacterium]